MRILLAALPIALLAACNSGADTATATADDAYGPAAATPAAPEPAMTVVTNARTATNWAGTYTGTLADGAAASLTLNADETYAWTMTPAGGTPVNVTGGFTWYRDGARVLLDAAGGGAIYAVGDGVIFKMANRDAPITGTMARESALVRAVAPAAAAPAAAPAN